MNGFNRYYKLLQSKYDEQGKAYGKGRPFEEFVRDFLPNCPGWSSIIKKIWLWDDYPDKWSTDIGIDLIFIDNFDKKWAVQAKCYDPKYSISKKEIDSFLSAATPKRIDKTLLIGTTDSIGKNAKIALKERETIIFLKKDFESINYNYPTTLSSKAKTTIHKKINAYPHQTAAIKDVIQGFKKNNRGQLIMACGTGKTYTSIWIDQQLKTTSTLVLVPTLSLIEKNLKDWIKMFGRKIDIICVCSDSTVSKNIETPFELSDLPYPVYTNAKDIQKFLYGKNKKLIISTYLSADIFEDVFKNSMIKGFDLTIFDEAHKCTGDNNDKLTLSALNPKIVKTDKYLFMTATPRESTDQIRRLAESKNKPIFYMDDRNIYGERFHELSFGEAIQKKLLNDYEVVIMGISDKRIYEFIDKRILVEISKKITSADELASTIGFLDCVKQYNLSKIITFHTTKEQARNFSDLLHDVNQSLKSNRKIIKKIITNSVSSDEPVYQRVAKINALHKTDKSEEVNILTNSRCLTEGVDIPSLDSVAFISPKRSVVDIIQATGRAIRLTKPRGIGYIIIPFFIEKDDLDDIDEKKLKSQYKYIFNILGALKEHDNILADTINELRIELGKKKVITRGQLPAKIIINMPSDVPMSFEDNIRSLIIEMNSEDWLEKYGLFKKYIDIYGSLENLNTTMDTGFHGVNLYTHYIYLRDRYKKNTLSEKRIKMYEELPSWSWTDNRRDKYYEILLKVGNEQGSVKSLLKKVKNPSKGHIYKHVRNIRTLKKKNRLSNEEIERYNKLPDWKWEGQNVSPSGTTVFSSVEKNYRALLKVVDDKGSVNHLRARDGILGKHISYIRSRKRDNKLSNEVIQKYNKIPGWKWKEQNVSPSGTTVFSAIEKNYRALLKVVDDKGSVNHLRSRDGILGKHIQYMRRRKRDNKLSNEVIQKYNKIPGWKWSPGYKWKD